jgi:hypothetical protein
LRCESRSEKERENCGFSGHRGARGSVTHPQNLTTGRLCVDLAQPGRDGWAEAQNQLSQGLIGWIVAPEGANSLLEK